MMAFLPFLKSPNLWLAAGILAMVVLIFNAGASHNERKHEAATAEVNAPILEQRGKDEAEIAASSAANAVSDAATSAAIAQRCILTPETAVLLARVK